MTTARPPAPPVHPPGAMSWDVPARGTTAVVFAPRGGTGATTFAANLACAAAPVRHSGAGQVSLLDFALPLGNLAAHAQCSPPRSLADIGDHLDDDSLASVVVSSDDGLRVLGCPGDPLVAEAITPAACVAALGWCARTSRLTIVDAGSALTEAAVAAIEAADVVLLHITGDRHVVASAVATRHLLATLGVHPRATRVVLNRVGAVGHLSPAEVATALGVAVDVVLAETPDIAMAARRGQVLIRAWPDHPYPRTVALLADSLQPAPLEPPPAASVPTGPVAQAPAPMPHSPMPHSPMPLPMSPGMMPAPPGMAPPMGPPPMGPPPGMPPPMGPPPGMAPPPDVVERRRFRWRRRRPVGDISPPLGHHAVG